MKNRGSRCRILTPNELDLSFRASNDYAVSSKLTQNCDRRSDDTHRQTDAIK